MIARMSLALMVFPVAQSIDENAIEICPTGTVQMALQSAAMNDHTYTCAQDIGVSVYDLMSGTRLSSEGVVSFSKSSSCKEFHQILMNSLKLIFPVCVDETTMLTTTQLGSISFEKRVEALTD